MYFNPRKKLKPIFGQYMFISIVAEFSLFGGPLADTQCI